MSNSTDWNPGLYLKFKDERTQPSIDLVNKIKIDYTPVNIVDIGCGPGSSSQILTEKWPSAHLVGVDSSPNMIEKANKDFPQNEWFLADAFEFNYPKKFDIVFSNATIQWIANHKLLMYKFHDMLSARGVLAIQIPLFWDMAIGKSIAKIALEDHWKHKLEDVENLFTIHDHHYYYDILSGLFSRIEIWKSSYIHVMESYKSILEMIRSTGLKPYLERLKSKEEKSLLEEKVLESIKDEYIIQKDGKVLFPFKRLFFTAYK
jgi:trans-aconitate 2-methyltransferase